MDRKEHGWAGKRLKKSAGRGATPAAGTIGKKNSRASKFLENPAVKIFPVDSATPGSPDEQAGQRLSIVGIGASAGGLEACSQLLSALPLDTGMAVVLVQHLAPKHSSVLPELLGGATKIPVHQALDGMRVEANNVYVIPPNVQMRIEDGKLRLLPRPDDHSQFMPIDYFFRSLAEFAMSRAIGIILSGTASDGAVGLREIKGMGGIIMAQDPKTARYDGMPRAAIATGLVDLVLPPEEMARELSRLSRHPFIRHIRPKHPGESLNVVDEHYSKIINILKSATGVNFIDYKKPTIKRRLQRRMVINKLASIQSYIRYLLENPAEVQSLYHDILIHVTRFFREPQSFPAMSEVVFPALLEKNPDGPLRVWVPGCSTGEEAYSVAVALLEFLEGRSESIPIQIFGTDISESAVSQARAGIYPRSIAGEVSPARLRRYFNKIDSSYRVAKEVRDLCVFARQDLTRDPPFSKLDMIACRNVLIYLEPVLQKKLLAVFHYALKPSGHLLLGAAETTGPHADLFTLVDKRFKIYRKKAMAPHRTELEFAPTGHQEVANPSKKPLSGVKGPRDIQTEASQVLLARFAPAGVVVDSDLQIVQFRGQTGAFLEPSAGEASLSLLKMAREGLLFGLRSAVHEARKADKPARREGLRVKSGEGTRDVNLEVIPLKDSPKRHYLVVFEAPRPPEVKAEPRRPAAGKKKRKGAVTEDHRMIQRLEDELAASREYLQSIIQDLEAANEELQSANEEVLSANEELQSTNEELDTAKEELQSTNEELNTVNEELHGRNEELSRANSDLLNLLGSVQIAIVMVSSDLRIRRFTPMAEKVLNLIPTDIGRPISDIKPNFECPDLERLLGEAIESVTVQEREVRDRQGGTYFLRIRPYKNLENRIEGAVISLFDITATKDESAQTELANLYGDTILDLVEDPLVIIDRSLRVKKANRAFSELFQVSSTEIEGRLFFELGSGRWDSESLRKALEHVVSVDSGFQDFRITGDFPRGGRKEMTLSARQLGTKGSENFLILITLKEAEPEQPTA